MTYGVKCPRLVRGIVTFIATHASHSVHFCRVPGGGSAAAGNAVEMGYMGMCV